MSSAICASIRRRRSSSAMSRSKESRVAISPRRSCSLRKPRTPVVTTRYTATSTAYTTRPVSEKASNERPSRRFRAGAASCSNSGTLISSEMKDR